jgi:hypothetical protein
MELVVSSQEEVHAIIYRALVGELVRGEQTKVLRKLRVLCANVLILCQLTASIVSAAESYALDYDAISQAEEHLEQAALDSPQRNRQDTIQRDVHDIVFLLDQSWKAAEKSDHAARKDYAQQALTLLERSAARGYFDLTKAEPVLMLIRQLLSSG